MGVASGAQHPKPRRRRETTPLARCSRLFVLGVEMNRRGLFGALAAGLAAVFGLGDLGQRPGFVERRERALDNFGRVQEVHVYGALRIGGRDILSDLSPDELKRMADDIAACVRAAPFAVIVPLYGPTWTEVV